MDMETGPPPLGDGDFDIAWEYLKQEMDRIMTHQADLSYSKYESLHMFIVNYCTSSPRVDLRGQAGPHLMARDLYGKLSNYFMAHLNEIYHLLEEVNDIQYLRYYTLEWDKYTFGAEYLHRVFSHLNQGWIKRERGKGREIYPVYTLALSQWKNKFFASVQKEPRLTSCVLRDIEYERLGGMIDSSLVWKVVCSLVALGGVDRPDGDDVHLGLYLQHFETPFIAETEKYYKNETKRLLEGTSFSDYLERLEARLKEEKDRSDRYLHASTSKILIQKCEEVMISQQLEQMGEGLRELLEQDKIKDLQRMYRLLSRIPEGTAMLRKVFEEYVKYAGQQAVSKLVGDGSSNIDSLEPKVYVETLLGIYHKNQYTVQQCFQNEMDLLAALNAACREFMNRNAATGTSTTKSPVLLAKYSHGLLCKNNRFAEESKREEALNQVVILFKHVDEKGVFQAFYASKLSQRLLDNISISHEAEVSMISKLTEACGLEYTLNLRRMLYDVNSSKNLSEGFRQHIDASNGPLGSNPYFEVLVFGRNLWPFQPSDPDFVIPGEIRSTHALFTQYYNFKHSGRALTWLWNYSKNELRTHYLQQEYLLMTSSYQMAVLLQYNAKDRISLNELIYSTGIPKRPMEPILTALVKAKVLLNGEPDQYELNLDFRSTKIRINLDLSVEEKVERYTEEVKRKDVEDSYNFIIQGTIVRIMKVRKTMKNQALIQEVICQISDRFTPKIREIKQAIEVLLEKEYIERVDGERDTFRYLP